MRGKSRGVLTRIEQKKKKHTSQLDHGDTRMMRTQRTSRTYRKRRCASSMGIVKLLLLLLQTAHALVVSPPQQRPAARLMITRNGVLASNSKKQSSSSSSSSSVAVVALLAVANEPSNRATQIMEGGPRLVDMNQYNLYDPSSASSSSNSLEEIQQEWTVGG